MNKILLISLDVIDDLNHQPLFKDFCDCLNTIIEEKNAVGFVSRLPSRVKEAKEKYGGINKSYHFITRQKAKKMIKEHGKSYFIFLGNRDVDFYTAVNAKMLFLIPTWVRETDYKARRYGLEIDNSKELLEIVRTANNQNFWYAYKELEDGSIVMSLMDGAYRAYSKSDTERILIKKFEEVLKQGNRNTFFEILLYHFLSAISNDNTLFSDVTIWGIFPSSTNKLNSEMLHFKETVREMMKCQEPRNLDIHNKNVLLRHTPVKKSQHTKGNIRYKDGSDKHLNSIYVNPKFKKKLKNATVCIFDDFLNYGNSFETARNLLKKAGAKKVIFVALGKFRKPYIYQDYDIEGDVTTDYFNFELINRYDISHLSFEINDEAKNEVENLHKIFNL
ncbi:phosphoribosyltransferase [Senegalia massiliensis]|uniref:Phosphoribosyltransferase n=1 Tax=Senegalia massiliensis TaxID=1720316 RepID=A0A845QXF2_9CLOT|nr:phosphoribosyltransferase [Senegalia massiliensis]NBI06830.1 phosphoribosyltransferase [Senegalia massiliensis]